MTNSLAHSSNTRSSVLVTPDTVQKDVAQARSSYTLSKDSAAKAAAYVYMVWRDTQSPYASQAMRDWFHKDVEQLNVKIDQHNAQLAVDKDRAKRFDTDKLKKDDPAALEPTNDEERKAVADERKKLDSWRRRSERQWE